jgi:hypothetical protein
MMGMQMGGDRVQASFRDPSGFLFKREGVLYRQINNRYSAEYNHLLASGLYEKLSKTGFLIAHKEVDVNPLDADNAFKVIQPEPINFISYPYEWSFSQTKDAALATLTIQKRALEYGMSLKDASAYNIQFHKGRVVLIDTLSFEFYKVGSPWGAYKQFCQHFLAPLVLMAKTDVRLSQLLRIYIDGVPLDLVSRLLPFSSRLNFGILAHIYLHAQAQVWYADSPVDQSRQFKGGMSKSALLALIESLQGAVKSLVWQPSGTEWGDYYNSTNYSDASFERKKEVLSGWIERVKPASVWDVGANTGVFTRLASDRGIPSIAFDIDPAAVEKNYRQSRFAKEKYILPLIQDLTNPTPSLGWHNRERDSLLERAPADMVFALAVIHHLAISNNVPLLHLAEFFGELGRWLVIEFVPKSDSQVKKLLSTRADIFDGYSLEGFEQTFEQYFIIHEKVNLEGSERWLYLLEARKPLKG